jgi:hypothetical protein
MPLDYHATCIRQCHETSVNRVVLATLAALGCAAGSRGTGQGGAGTYEITESCDGVTCGQATTTRTIAPGGKVVGSSHDSTVALKRLGGPDPGRCRR